MKVVHEKNKCIGCAGCTAVCSKFFEMDEERRVTLKNGVKRSDGKYELEIKELDCLQDAVNICPVQIIKIEE
ncbi:MAG: ferredoxin [bacterium]|nr:ferredoxin [bacterium]